MKRDRINPDDAQRFMENPVFVDAVAEVRAYLHDKWAKSPPDDAVLQRDLRLKLFALDAIVGVLKMAVQSGKIDDKKEEGFFKQILRGVK